MYKINVNDRGYNKIQVIDRQNLQQLNITVDAIKHKLLNQDIFSIKNGVPKIEHSTIRSMLTIPAVLVLNGNRTYGKRKNKFLYKCIPDDSRIPEFLVPYKIKAQFNKHLMNKYVIFKFKHWNNKHPEGVLVNVLGDVNELPNFYEYQLYCKSLYASIQNFTKQTMKRLRQKSETEFINQIIESYNIEDRRDIDYEIISIDPVGSKDFDDAFSFIEHAEHYTFSIYIANVALWMDALELWDSFSQRISTIYLPDRKRPMLPTILSDTLCSLQEGHSRFAFTLDITINKATMEVVKTQLSNTVIRVTKNFRYDTKEQETNPTYNQAYDFVSRFNKTHPYLDNIKTSHDFVAYTMIWMNYTCAKKMRDLQIGIYRSALFNNDFEIPDNVPLRVRKFLKNWYSSGGNYVKFENTTSHEMLSLDIYVHITSPIRRLVDLLNIIKLQETLGISQMDEKCDKFYERWTNETAFKYINETMKSIRKVQNDCSLLNICVTDNSILKKEYVGYIFDKMGRNDGLVQYMIYLPAIGMTNRIITTKEYSKYEKRYCKLYIFHDENRLKQKVRVQIL